MINIVLFGPPGAGKGTQSEKLISKYGFVHLSTGDIFRRNIKEATELGQLAKSYMDQGQLVPDSVTISMLQAEVVKSTGAKGFIFDGFPRNANQANALDTFLKGNGTAITKMIALEVPEEELRKRLLERGKTSGRPDDVDPLVIQKRIDVYNSETAPVKDYYQTQGKYAGVNGVGSIESIFELICDVIDSVSTAKASSAPKKESAVPVVKKVKTTTVKNTPKAPAKTTKLKPAAKKVKKTSKKVVAKKAKTIKKKAAKKTAKKSVAASTKLSTGKKKKTGKRGRPSAPKRRGRPQIKKRGRPTSPKRRGRPQIKKRGRPTLPKKRGRPQIKKRGRPTLPKKRGRPQIKKRGRPTLPKPKGRPQLKKRGRPTVKKSTSKKISKKVISKKPAKKQAIKKKQVKKKVSKKIKTRRK